MEKQLFVPIRQSGNYLGSKLGRYIIMELPTLSQKQVIRFLHISSNTLNKLEDQGRLRVLRINHKILLYYMSDILKIEKEVKLCKVKNFH